jgi:NADH-quinone oxidoreductase subunit C
MLINNKINLLKIICNFRMGLIHFFSQIFYGVIKSIKLISEFSIRLEVVDVYIYPILLVLKNHSLCLFNILIDIIIYETLGSPYRFIIIYNILTVKFTLRLYVKTKVKELTRTLLSISSLFHSSIWLEREIFDFYGLHFMMHQDLRRLLLDYGFLGYPLRKDFPLSG